MDLCQEKVQNWPQSALKCRIFPMRHHGSKFGWGNSTNSFPLILQILLCFLSFSIREFEFSDPSVINTKLHILGEGIWSYLQTHPDFPFWGYD